MPHFHFPRKMPAAGRGERVVPRAPVVLRDAPFRVDQPLPFEAVEGGIEGALAELEDMFGPLLDALGDAPPVHRLELQGSQDQHVERALQHVASIFGCHVTPFDRRKEANRCSFRASRGKSQPLIVGGGALAVATTGSVLGGLGIAAGLVIRAEVFGRRRC